MVRQWIVEEQRSGLVADPSSRESPLAVLLGEAVAAGAYAGGFAVAADTHQLAQAIAVGPALQAALSLSVGHVDIEWRPASGRHDFEQLDVGRIAAVPSTPVSIRASQGGRALLDEPCEFNLSYKSPEAARWIERDWGRYSLRSASASSETQTGPGVVTFERALLGGEYVACVHSLDGLRYGIGSFVHDGQDVDIETFAANRLAGTLLASERPCALPRSVSLSVKYVGEPMALAWNWSGKVDLDPNGRFEVVVLPAPRATLAIPLPAPVRARLLLRAVGYQPWTSEVSWSASLLDLETIQLVPDEPDLELRPLAHHRDELWYSVFGRDWIPEVLVESALACSAGDRVFIDLAEDDRFPGLRDSKQILVARDPGMRTASGFISEATHWTEVPQAQYGMTVELASALAHGELVVVGFAWKGIRIPLGSFDSADFDPQVLLSVEGPREEMILWGYRKLPGPAGSAAEVTLSLTPGETTLVL